MTPFKRPHRWTGRPKGPPRGSQNRLTHGLKTAAHKTRRKEVNAMLREARQAIRDARQQNRSKDGEREANFAPDPPHCPLRPARAAVDPCIS